MDGIKTGVCPLSRDELGGCPFIGQAVSGMEATRARSAAPTRNVRRPDPILPVWFCVQWARGSSPGVCWGVSTVAGSVGGPVRSSDEALVMGVEPRDRVICDCVRWINQNPLGFGRSRVNELKSPGKPFEISKWAVMQAWEKVKANKGAPGVDGVSIEEFEADLNNNLYKVWNRMSSGTWFAPPVRAVEIPKPHGGGTRMLGIATVADRVAQTVVAMELEKVVEPVFHDDSYGYRPGRSPLDAVGKCRQRCWKADWVIDLDIQKFFDNVSWDLMLKAVAVHTDSPWVMLYVKRWLAAPLQLPDGTLQQRDRGTPQGSPASPVLANLFMHYAFDVWMAGSSRP